MNQINFTPALAVYSEVFQPQLRFNWPRGDSAVTFAESSEHLNTGCSVLLSDYSL